MNLYQICLKCEKTLVQATHGMECLVCGTQWPADRGIPSYDSAKYYGEVSQETMLDLIALAEKGHWRTAARTMFGDSNPELYHYMADLNRASWIPILPIGPHSTVLDVNSGLGAVTHALALNYHHVVSVEPVAEMARFAKLRLNQEGLTNVELVQTTLSVLPFSKGTFDLIVLNGVLEWVRQWRNSRTSTEAQIEALKDLRRLLKPHGVLVIGSENRTAHTRFLHRTDYAPGQFTDRMLRWFPSFCRRPKSPGFYRSLMDPTTAHRPYTHTPHGYLKLLRQAGFGSVDLWWPPNGYNSPHTLFRASSRVAIKAHWDHERRDKDRLHGYAIARQIRHWALVDTGLIHMMFPDVIMIATSMSKHDKRLHTAVPVLAAFEQFLAIAPESSANTVGSRHNRYYADSLTTHPYRNKTVINVVSFNNEPAVVKVANVRLQGAETVQRSYHKLQRLSSRFDASDLLLAGSIPSPLAVVRVGSQLATMERSARGTRLVDLILHQRYFRCRERVRTHLEQITSWLIASKPALDALESDSLFEPIPLGWLLAPDGDSAAADGSIPEHFSGVQHGDFYPENIFIDETSGHISVIDWDDCGTGYPPLFDWFCLVTGLYYYSERVPGIAARQTAEFLSFRQTYFAASWFSDLILSLSHRLCQSLRLDSARLLDYFRSYIIVRYRQCCRGGGSFFPHLYKQYYEFLLKNQKQCCFWQSPGP
jgi:SAM-dependent methyltransferase